MSGFLFAHHGAMAYDRTKLTNFKATITEFRWSNPHVQIFFAAKDEKGNVTHWNCESINPGMLAKQGWTKRTLKAGDEVTIAAYPAKFAGKEEFTVCLLQTLTLADGTILKSVLLD
jgi:hypothetical protein